MRRLWLIAVVVSLVVPAPAAHAFPGAPYFAPGQPYAQNFPDPSVVWDAATGRYYAFGTTTGGVYVPAMWSSDLVTWTAAPDHGSANGNGQRHDALPVPDTSGIARRNPSDPLTYELWAPGVAKVGSTWVMFYTLLVNAASGKRCLWYATSATPLGPYSNPTYFHCSGDPQGSIDPQPFVDDDGRAYLVWKDEGLVDHYGQRTWAQRIVVGAPGPSAVSFAPGSSPALLIESDNTWEAYVAESPSLVRHHGELYLFYSGGYWASDDYATGVAACRGLTGSGPLCDKHPANPILTRKQPDKKAIGGPTVFEDASGQLRVAFHWWKEGYASGYPAFPACESQGPSYCTENQRRLGIERLQFQFGRVLASSETAPASGATLSGFTPREPERVLDTRFGLFDLRARQTERSEVTVLDLSSKVAPGTAAVALNVTVAEAVRPGWVTVYPCGDAPEASNLNYSTGDTVANHVVVRLNASRRACLYSHEKVHLLADLAGEFSASSGGRFTGVAPTRLLDTRIGLGRTGSSRVAAGTSVEIAVAGRAGVPTNATAAVFNVTAVDAQRPGYLTVYPCGSTVPVASNVNYASSAPTPNLVTAQLSSSGSVCVFAERDTHILLDVSGSYSAVGALLLPLAPMRAFDSRGGAPISAGEVREFALPRLPPGATAAVINVGVTGPADAGYATVFPCGSPPTASNLNFATGQTVANLVTVALSSRSTVCVFAERTTHAFADLAGYYVQ